MAPIHPTDLSNLRVPPTAKATPSTAPMQPAGSLRPDEPEDEGSRRFWGLQLRKENGTLYLQQAKIQEQYVTLQQKHAALQKRIDGHEDKEASLQATIEGLSGKINSLTDKVGLMEADHRTLHQRCETTWAEVAALKARDELFRVERSIEGPHRLPPPADPIHARKPHVPTPYDEFGVVDCANPNPATTGPRRSKRPVGQPKGHAVVLSTEGKATSSTDPDTAWSTLQEPIASLKTPRHAQAHSKLLKPTQGVKTTLDDYVAKSTMIIKNIDKHYEKQFITGFIKGMHNAEEKAKLQKHLKSKYATTNLPGGGVEIYCEWADIEDALRITGLAARLEEDQPSKRKKRKIQIPPEAMM